MMRRSILCAAALAALPGVAAAQSILPQEKLLPQPVEPGQVAPWRAGAPAAADPAETGSLHVAPSGPTLADWYAKQGRPPLVLYFDRRLENLPPGWDGTARLMFAHEKQSGGKTETETLSVGIERKAPVRSLRQRSPVVKLVENALTSEMQRAGLKLIDPSFAERAHAARSKGGDTEFDSLKGAAGYVLEVELAATGDAVSMLGSLKSLNKGEIVATVRQPVEHDLRDPADADTLARSFFKRLLAFQPDAR